MLLDKSFAIARSGEIIIQCIEARIYQKNDSGLRMDGHGVIRINSVGSLYMEFVCLKSENIPFHFGGSDFPKDLFDPKQELFFECVSLDGEKIEANGFSLSIKEFDTHRPFRFLVFFSEIYKHAHFNHPNQQNSYLYFEINEPSRVPKNKGNTTTSTLGTESWSLNQTVLKGEEFGLSIVDHKGYVEVYANGDFDVDSLFLALTFYIGFTSGTSPQAYAMTKRSGTVLTHYIRSIRNSVKHQTIPHPIPENVIIDGALDFRNNYELFFNIWYVLNNHHVYFESIYAQWKRVFAAFNTESALSNLTISTSVEGVLIDIFMPKLAEEARDEAYEKEKLDIIEKLKGLDIAPAKLNTIIKHVAGWGNLYAAKALGMLVEKNLISTAEKKAWEKLRHSAAHPKFTPSTTERQIKEHHRVASCINLFNKLVLNVYSYSGPQFEFGEVRKPRIIMHDMVDILGLEKQSIQNPSPVKSDIGIVDVTVPDGRLAIFFNKIKGFVSRLLK
ncbi:hypothetical protein [Pseudomonas sp. WS 5146]|uniref:hypothetical protein n=1 Tax=Pseudomonas sp. WS 5146 TaxID=2717494 RepID=UPI001473AF04|nr:hypothetical protein [Pseudomonas sp. WS 5146]NMX57127.1 hypothetical protein [Pseudomonas sp. WS 5146]